MTQQTIYFEGVQDLQRLGTKKRLFEILYRSFDPVIRRAERMRISNRNAALSFGVQRGARCQGNEGIVSLRRPRASNGARSRLCRRKAHNR
jgi:hypothetical protein